MSVELYWNQLHKRMTDQIADIDGLVGLCVYDLNSGNGFSINGDEAFPTASTIKIHVLTQLFLQAELGNLNLDDQISSVPWNTGGSGVLAYLDDAPELTLRDLANLMIVASDNSATNVCIDSVGIQSVNALLDDLGLEQTRLRRKMMDGEASRGDQDNVSTPSELVQMLRLLYHDLPNASVAQKTLHVLRKPKSGFIDRVVPPAIEVANKPGWNKGVRCDAGIVYLQRHPYVMAIMMKYGSGTPESLDAMIASLARTVHSAMITLEQSNAFGQIVYPS